MALDSWRGPAQGSSRVPRGGGAEARRVQAASLPRAGFHSVISGLACVYCHCLCAGALLLLWGSQAGVGVDETHKQHLPHWEIHVTLEGVQSGALEEEVQPLPGHAREGRWHGGKLDRGGYSLSGPAFRAQLMVAWDGTGAGPSGALIAPVLFPPCSQGSPGAFRKKISRLMLMQDAMFISVTPQQGMGFSLFMILLFLLQLWDI